MPSNPPAPFWPVLTDSPLVSVIVPACNCADFLEETLQSIVDQDYPHLEIIVIDDGSTDDTAAVARGFQGPVQLLQTAQPSSGAGASRNVGLRAARGDLIAFLDGDDVWLPGKLQAQIECLRAHPECAMVASEFALWSPDENGMWRAPGAFARETGEEDPQALDPERSGWIYHRLLLDTIVWTGAVVMRRELVETVGQFREDLRLAQDYDYWLRASRLSPVLTLARSFALYRRHPQSATRKWAPVNYAASVLETAIQTWGLNSPDGQGITQRELRNRRFGLHFSMGYNLFHSGDRAAAAPSFLEAGRNQPTYWRTWPYLFLSGLSWTGQRLTGRLP
ncbi:glycosyltransferase [Thioalkalivibrio sp. ALJT]|uniref:glycosyltransferase family 2 protein n=1 Tax=Thioalkalivibrio sp. ALJT TaxID=1158146 RepID=UPI000570DBF9|nr:glycosyltransferase [Thioalkalivibrio sp. ALJT]